MPRPKGVRVNNYTRLLRISFHVDERLGMSPSCHPVCLFTPWPLCVNGMSSRLFFGVHGIPSRPFFLSACGIPTRTFFGVNDTPSRLFFCLWHRSAPLMLLFPHYPLWKIAVAHYSDIQVIVVSCYATLIECKVILKARSL